MPAAGNEREEDRVRTTRRHLIAEVATRPVETDLVIRPVTLEDADDLAALMVDAYAGAPEARSDEALDGALAEVHKFFGGLYGEPMLDASMVAVAVEGLASASLISRYQGAPLLALLMTASIWKHRGLARATAQSSMNALAEKGETTLALIVTAANRPALDLSEELGFRDFTS